MLKSYKEYKEQNESALDGTSGYDKPLSQLGQHVIQMCGHYFQTLSDEQIKKVADMIMQFAVQNRNSRA